MLDALKETGRHIGREIGRAWDNLSEGWHELLSRSSNALTHFSRGSAGQPDKASDSADAFPSWSLLAGELEESRSDIVIRIEMPGLDRDDCTISIDGNRVVVRGEKRFEREAGDSTYHVMERAYGSFQRVVVLPCSVDADKASAKLRNGVLTVRLPKAARAEARSVPVA